jgi:hypothetical protein
MFKTFLTTLFFAISARAANVVTMTVGQVGEHILTSREVQISYVAEGLLFPSGKTAASFRELRLEDTEFRTAVTSTLLEAVVALEAENFNVGTVADADVTAGIATIERATAGKAYWANMEVSAAELKTFVLRKMVAKSFLRFKTNSMAGIISDQEALAYFEKNRVKFGNVPFAQYKDNIKNYLAQQQLEERLRSWFEVIKRKYKVRNFISE